MSDLATRALHPSTRIITPEYDPGGRVEGAGGPGTRKKSA
ncbi:hypothetical protein BPTFM16_02526 [Altererythrobacter insulae]|nr:hypothetical protein BPTFM16_02526 [Altererythrobacter insulae]